MAGGGGGGVKGRREVAGGGVKVRGRAAGRGEGRGEETRGRVKGGGGQRGRGGRCTKSHRRLNTVQRSYVMGLWNTHIPKEQRH